MLVGFCLAGILYCIYSRANPVFLHPPKKIFGIQIEIKQKKRNLKVTLPEMERNIFHFP